jgi:hypothetical protein
MTKHFQKLLTDAKNVLTWECGETMDPLMFRHMRRFAREIVRMLIGPVYVVTSMTEYEGFGLDIYGPFYELDDARIFAQKKAMADESLDEWQVRVINEDKELEDALTEYTNGSPFAQDCIIGQLEREVAERKRMEGAVMTRQLDGSLS